MKNSTGQQNPASKKSEHFTVLPDIVVRSPILSHRAFRLYIVYLSHRNEDKGGTAWPGITKLQRETGMGRSTVCVARQELIDAELIKLVESGDQKGNTNKYWVDKNPDASFETRLVLKRDQSQNETTPSPKTGPHLVLK